MDKDVITLLQEAPSGTFDARERVDVQLACWQISNVVAVRYELAVVQSVVVWKG